MTSSDDRIDPVDLTGNSAGDASRPRGDGPGSGGHPRSPLARRLPVALLVVGVALGFVIGSAIVASADSDSSSGTAAVAANGNDQLTQAIAAAGTAGAIDDRGFSKLENGVQHSHTFELPLPPEERALLTHQMDLARQVALEYPTLADAEAAGATRAGAFSPGLGAHMIMGGNFRYGATDAPMTDEQIRHPIAWIYDGTKPDSKIAGLFYLAVSRDPAGFVGPNDVWHQHSNICIVMRPGGGTDAPLGADRDATKAQCDAVGGRLITATGPLLHVWAVPGYEDSQGVYAHLNPAITCVDGTYDVIPDITKVGSRTSLCKDGVE